MQLSGISNGYGGPGVQKALALLVSEAASASQGAGQVLPGVDQDPGRQGPPPPPPPRSSRQASDQFASNTLASLLSVQQQPSASDFAAKLIGQVDANGDGNLSLDEIKATLEKAGLTKASSNAGAGDVDPLAQAFGKLDGNKDGQLDSTELTSALEAMMASHHRRRHGPPPPPPGDATAGSTAPVATTATTVTSGINAAASA